MSLNDSLFPPHLQFSLERVSGVHPLQQGMLLRQQPHHHLDLMLRPAAFPRQRHLLQHGALLLRGEHRSVVDPPHAASPPTRGTGLIPLPQSEMLMKVFDCDGLAPKEQGMCWLQEPRAPGVWKWMKAVLFLKKLSFIFTLKWCSFCDLCYFCKDSVVG